MEITTENYLLADPDFSAQDPLPNAKNFAFEEQEVPLHLRGIERGLQVGCMNGTRIISFSEAAPGVHIDGLDIDETLVSIARKNIRAAGLASQVFLGDIMSPPAELQPASYDLVYATNNTLGYLDPEAALTQMRSLSRGKVLVSLFSDERFSDKVAQEYFARMKMDTNAMSIEGNIFNFDNGDGDPTTVRRFSRKEVLAWGGELTETPLGFYVLLSANSHTVPEV